jgi:hypothetical protein
MKAEMTDFEIWWYREGSGITPNKDDDFESHAKRVAEIAWDNGAYCASQKFLAIVKEN